jgi:hypothetical protein
MLILLGFSIYLVTKTKDADRTVAEESVIEIETPKLPEQFFNFEKDSLSEDCSIDDSMYCAIETAVKCTINPEFSTCAKADLPKFIFMNEPGLDRPTEMNYKIVDKKILGNGTTEIYTESNCNGSWFGLCQGTIIYIMAQKPENVWYVKDIYGIE